LSILQRNEVHIVITDAAADAWAWEQAVKDLRQFENPPSLIARKSDLVSPGAPSWPCLGLQLCDAPRRWPEEQITGRPCLWIHHLRVGAFQGIPRYRAYSGCRFSWLRIQTSHVQFVSPHGHRSVCARLSGPRPRTLERQARSIAGTAGYPNQPDSAIWRDVGVEALRERSVPCRSSSGPATPVQARWKAEIR
jgi:hypothetical protein